LWGVLETEEVMRIKTLPAILILAAALFACNLPVEPAPSPAPPTATASPVRAVASPSAQSPGGTATAPAPTATATATASASAQPPAGTPSLTQPPALLVIQVYFTDRLAYAAGRPPYEVAVTRTVPAGSNLPAAVLAAFFQGPTPAERAVGLDAVTSGFTGVSRLTIAGGIARVYLSGECQSGGATYTIAQPLGANLRQFAEVRFVKIYDAQGTTEQPDGDSDSIPACLEP
jgi:hypothetical protein